MKEHLLVDAAAYDAAIRTFVVDYEEMIATGVALLGALLATKTPRVLDLGGGTGALSEAVLRAMPEARVTLLDIDPKMLAQARVRLAAFGERVTFREASFEDELPAMDAVVASLSLHHLPDMGKKTRVYGAIHRALPAGGVFLNLDATVSRDPRVAALTFDAWAAYMGRHGIAPAAARQHLKDWEKEDHYQPLYEELAALATAGFAAPECFWRRGPSTVYGGRKS